MHLPGIKGQYQPWNTLRLWPGFFFKENKPAKSARIVHWLHILRGFYYSFLWTKEKAYLLIKTLAEWQLFPPIPSSMRCSILGCTIVGKCFFTAQTCLGVKPDIRTPRGYYSCKGWLSICIEEVLTAILYTSIKL